MQEHDDPNAEVSDAPTETTRTQGQNSPFALPYATPRPARYRRLSGSAIVLRGYLTFLAHYAGGFVCIATFNSGVVVAVWLFPFGWALLSATGNYFISAILNSMLVGLAVGFVLSRRRFREPS